jgi:hypothetical protein
VIPVLAGLRFDLGSRRRPRIWIPLPLLWLLLLPFAIPLLPLSVAACLICSIPPRRALGALWQILSGLGGTHIEVDAPGVSILITLR